MFINSKIVTGLPPLVQMSRFIFTTIVDQNLLERGFPDASSPSAASPSPIPCIGSVGIRRRLARRWARHDQRRPGWGSTSSGESAGARGSSQRKQTVSRQAGGSSCPAVETADRRSHSAAVARALVGSATTARQGGRPPRGGGVIVAMRGRCMGRTAQRGPGRNRSPCAAPHPAPPGVAGRMGRAVPVRISGGAGPGRRESTRR